MFHDIITPSPRSSSSACLGSPFFRAAVTSKSTSRWRGLHVHSRVAFDASNRPATRGNQQTCE